MLLVWLKRLNLEQDLLLLEGNLQGVVFIKMVDIGVFVDRMIHNIFIFFVFNMNYIVGNNPLYFCALHLRKKFLIYHLYQKNSSLIYSFISVIKKIQYPFFLYKSIDFDFWVFLYDLILNIGLSMIELSPFVTKFLHILFMLLI